MRSLVARYLGGYRQVDSETQSLTTAHAGGSHSSDSNGTAGNGGTGGRAAGVNGVNGSGSGVRGGEDVEMAERPSLARASTSGGAAALGAGEPSVQAHPPGSAAPTTGSAGPGPGSAQLDLGVMRARCAAWGAAVRRACWETPLAFAQKLALHVSTLGCHPHAGGMLVAVAFVLLFSALAVQSTPPANTAGTATLDVWIIAGQSNAVGDNGEDGQALPEVCFPLSGRILRFSPAGNWEDAQPNIHYGVHNYSSPLGVGPGIAFARTLLDSGAAQRVGLIPAAMAGSGLAEHWQPPFSPLYRFLVSQAHQAVLRTHGAQLRGIVWVQGETDGKDPSAAQAYGHNLHNLVLALRYDLSDLLLRGRSLLWVMGVMAARDQRTQLPWLPYLSEVRTQQQRFVIDHLIKVDMTGYEFFNQTLPNHPPGLIHLSKAGQGAFGTALAHAVNEYRLGAVLQTQIQKDKGTQDKQDLLAQQADGA